MTWDGVSHWLQSAAPYRLGKAPATLFLGGWAGAGFRNRSQEPGVGGTGPAPPQQFRGQGLQGWLGPGDDFAAVEQRRISLKFRPDLPTKALAQFGAKVEFAHAVVARQPAAVFGANA